MIDHHGRRTSLLLLLLTLLLAPDRAASSFAAGAVVDHRMVGSSDLRVVSNLAETPARRLYRSLLPGGSSTGVVFASSPPRIFASSPPPRLTPPDPLSRQEGEPEGGDTVAIDTSSAGGRLRREEYLWAGHPRYSITGLTPMRVTSIEPLPAAITFGIVAGSVTAIHIYQQNAWWADQRGPFYFQVAWDYAAQADKLGHMLAGNFTSYLAHEALVSSGFSQSTAAWLGPTIALAFMTYVEIEDGFGANWGFDPTDQYANTAGVALFAAQQYLPWLQNVAMKWSYWPTGKLNQGEPGHKTIVVDDYNGQTVWFSLKASRIVPQSLGWPAWLRLAGGYGATNVDIIDSTGRLLEPGRRIFVALDYDLVELLPDMGSFGNWMVQTLDYLHLPAPAVEVYPTLRFHLLYPVPL